MMNDGANSKRRTRQREWAMKQRHNRIVRLLQHMLRRLDEAKAAYVARRRAKTDKC